jgi:glutathione S-transferase
MIIVHHLNNSRSQKILWLLEELGADYDVRYYQRHPVTQSAPPEMKALHPMGRSPMIEVDGRIMIETGAIIDYILRKHGNGRLQPAVDTPEYDEFMQWMHYSEGSGMLPLLMKIYVTMNGPRGGALDAVADQDIDRHLSYLEGAMAGREFLVGGRFTAADIHTSFLGEVAQSFVSLDRYPNVAGWLDRLHARPAFMRAIKRGGPYSVIQKTG